MNVFVSHIVIAGVLCFVGGILAWLANRARILGAVPLWPRLVFGAAAATLGFAIWLVVSGVDALPKERKAAPPSPGLPDVSDFVR